MTKLITHFDAPACQFWRPWKDSIKDCVSSILLEDCIWQPQTVWIWLGSGSGLGGQLSPGRACADNWRDCFDWR